MFRAMILKLNNTPSKIALLTGSGYGLGKTIETSSFNPSPLTTLFSTETSTRSPPIPQLTTETSNSNILDTLYLISPLNNIAKISKNVLIGSLISIFTTAGICYYKNIGINDILYASRAQLKEGIKNINDGLDKTMIQIGVVKEFILEKLGKSEKRIKLEITEKTNEIKGRITQMKGDIERKIEDETKTIKETTSLIKADTEEIRQSQSYFGRIQDMIKDKLSMLEYQSAFTSKGVYLLCNTLTEQNDNKHNKQSIEQHIKQHDKQHDKQSVQQNDQQQNQKHIEPITEKQKLNLQKLKEFSSIQMIIPEDTNLEIIPINR